MIDTAEIFAFSAPKRATRAGVDGVTDLVVVTGRRAIRLICRVNRQFHGRKGATTLGRTRVKKRCW